MFIQKLGSRGSIYLELDSKINFFLNGSSSYLFYRNGLDGYERLAMRNNLSVLFLIVDSVMMFTTGVTSTGGVLSVFTDSTVTM